MNILIGGGTGFVGSALAAHLLAANQRVTIKTRRTDIDGERIKYINRFDQVSPGETFDVVINLAGEPIASKRWTEQQKQERLRSRLEATQEFIDYFQEPEHRPSLFISGSAIGFYGVGSGDEVIDETCSGDDSFSNRLLLAGKKVLPSKMEKTDFQFKYRRLEEALSDIL